MAPQKNRNQKKFEEKVIRISRVSTKTKGGDQMSFSALMVVGDRKGKIGVALGKAPGVVDAIRKGARLARKKMIEVPRDGTTIPFTIEGKFGAGHVLLKPAAPGSGVIAGGSVRQIMEVAGIKDVSAKILGSDNPATNVYAALEALKATARIVKVRDITLNDEGSDQKSKKKQRAKSKTKKTKKKKQSKAKKKTAAKKHRAKKTAAKKEETDKEAKANQKETGSKKGKNKKERDGKKSAKKK